MALPKIFCVLILCKLSEQVYSQYEMMYSPGNHYPRGSLPPKYPAIQGTAESEGYELRYPLGHHYPRKHLEESKPKKTLKTSTSKQESKAKQLPILYFPPQSSPVQYTPQQFSEIQYNPKFVTPQYVRQPQQQPRGFLGPLLTDYGNQYLASANRYDQVGFATGFGDPRYSARLRNIGVAKRNWGALFNYLGW